MTNSPYFVDNPKLDIFDAILLSVTLSRLYCILIDFHVALPSQGKTDFLLLFSDFRPRCSC